jgi:hypothetical protein
MKRLGLILVLMVFCFADVAPIRGRDTDNVVKDPSYVVGRGTLIDSVGDIRAVMGPQGKSICVSDDGNAIAVIYGGPTGSTTNILKVMIAYSTNGGANWVPLGPFSPDMRRIYPGLDGSADFDAQAGELFFTWHESPNGYNEGVQKVMIEENVPSAPSPSVPIVLPSTSGANFCPWEVCVAVNPENAMHVLASSISYLNNGNNNFYVWVSTDGGYSWTDSINISLGEVVDNGHVRFGTGGYVFANMHVDSILLGTYPIPTPYYNESTDGGFTWLGKQMLPVPYLDTLSSFWWHELDCEVINNEVWTIHTNTESSNQDSMWLFHGTGSPGARVWDVFDVRGLASLDVTIGDTLFQCEAVRGAGFPQICYDPVNNIILAAFTTVWFAATPTDTIYNGWYIGGVFSTDGGSTWRVARPLNDVAFDVNTLGVFEVAHRIVNGQTYAIFIHELELDAYFFGASVVPVGIEESSGQYVTSYRFGVTPSVTSNTCRATFTVPAAGNISLSVYDVSGSVVDRVFSGYAAGDQVFNINTSHLANGTYFVVLENEQVNISQKIVKLH